jgi:hypothetical protein
MLIDRRRLLVGSAALTFASAAGAQMPAAASDVHAPDAIIEDLTLLRAAYGRLHPGLERYLALRGFDRLVQAAIGWADRARSSAEVYLMLCRLTAAIRCGHSFPNPANQRKAVRQGLIGRADRLPFCTAWVGRRLIITDPVGSGLTRGCEVLAIDGVPAGSLLNEMLPLTRADGHNDAKRVAQLELHRGDRFAPFDVLRSLLRAGDTGSVSVRVRDAAGRTRTARLATVAEGTRGLEAGSDPSFGWRFGIGEDGVGVLTMPDWALYDTKWDWRGFLRGVIEALVQEGARGLVIDLRENEGGLDCGNVLLAGLIERPIMPPPERRLIRFRETPAALRPVLDTWDASFHRLGVGAPPVADKPGFFDLGPAEDGRIDPSGPRFAGNVAVLVGPTCSSATFRFADLVRRNRVGQLVGSPTGGNRRGINGGCFFFVRLPRTGFEVDLPLIGYFPNSKEPDAGIAPDVPVAPTVAEIVAGRDAAMIAAGRLCSG